MIPIPPDLIPKGQEDLFKVIQQRLESLEGGSSSSSTTRSASGSYSGSHKQRLTIRPGSQPVGTTFFEEERSVFYTVTETTGAGRIWRYTAGVMRGTLYPTDQKPTGLDNKGDVGFMFYSTDFLHTYRWSGSAWELVDAMEPGITVFSERTLGSGWKVMDGTGNPVRLSTPSGGTVTQTLPNLVGAFFKGAAAAATTVTAGVGVTSAAAGSTVQVATSTSSGVFLPLSSHQHAETEYAHADAIPYMRL